MRSILRSLSVATALLVSATASPAGAQAQRPPLTIEQPFYQTIAFNPIGLPFGLFSADYERALSPGVTLGIGGSYVDFINSSRSDGWFDVKALYYPGEEALKGFAVGLTAGYHRSADTESVFGEDLHSDGAPTLGVVVDYNWLLGKRRRFLVGLGLGAKRVLKNVSDDSALSEVIPGGRFSIGLAF
jgi:hypothetical protein